MSSGSELASGELVAQLALDRLLAMVARDDRQGRAITRRRHQLPRLGLADAALLDQLPFQTLADGVDQLIDQLVRQRRPADQAVMNGAVVAVVLGDAPQRGDRQLRAGIAGQGGNHFRFAGIREQVGQPLRQMLAPGHGERILHGVRAHDLARDRRRSAPDCIAGSRAPPRIRRGRGASPPCAAGSRWPPPPRRAPDARSARHP